MTNYRIYLQMTDNWILLIKLINYSLSFLMRHTLTNVWLFEMRNTKEINYAKVKMLKIIRKLHFTVFKSLLADLSFLGTRSILHVEIK